MTTSSDAGNNRWFVDDDVSFARASLVATRCAVSVHNAVPLRPPTMIEIKVGQVWEQVSKHERGMRLEVVRDTGRRWVLRPVGGGPSKKRGLREGVWTLSTEQINATCRLVRDVD